MPKFPDWVIQSSETMLEHLPDNLYQFAFGNRNTHYFIIGLRIYHILVANDFHQLSIIDLWNQHLIEVVDDFSQIFRKGTEVADMGMTNGMALF